MKLTPYSFRIFVEHLDQAKLFYEETLGWKLSVDGSSYGYLVFEPGHIKIIVEQTSKAQSDEEGGLLGRFTALSLEVEDLEAAYAELTTRGVEFTGGPETQPWGGVLAWFRDGEGNVLTLVQEPRPVAD